ncbi:hypothetical protein F4818DRAFT_374064 [Hypoxylon cercidicola]|nr:hypothetical protein F4818DRAFT_374064 [Hypoxylon cercidicola]
MLPDIDPHREKMAIDTENDALRRRRDRGRRSQAAFRKRQAEANQRIKDQNNQLKRAIERLVHTTRGDEQPELLNSIFDVAEAAGVDVERPSQRDSTQPSPRHVSENSRIRLCPVGGEDDITISAITRDVIGEPSHQTNSDSGLSAPSSAPPPRLTCGLWLDNQHYMRISVPPDDIIPYLGPGSNTFAGKLFWSLLNHTRKKCTRTHTDAAILITKALGHSKVTEDWPVKYIEAMVEARLEYKQTGSIRSSLASAAEPDLAMAVRDRITADYQARGMDPDLWISVMGIEKRVKRMVGDAAFAVLEAAAKGEGDPVLQHLFEIIECKLHETCVCFGDGPRWKVDTVDGIFLDWVHTAFWATSRRGWVGDEASIHSQCISEALHCNNR